MIEAQREEAMDEYMHATQIHHSVTRQLSGSIPEQVTTLRELIRQLTRTADSWEHIHEMAKEEE